MKLTNTGKRILCLHEGNEIYHLLKPLLAEKGYFVYDYLNAEAAAAHIYNTPPDIILVSTEIPDWEKFTTQLKTDSVYKHLPLILLTKEEKLPKLLAIQGLVYDDFFLENSSAAEILLRIRNCDDLANLELDANPLTRLPGNYTIMSNIQKVIWEKQDSALCYLDLDNFKAFNDCYGFASGDEAILMTSRIITNVVHLIVPAAGFVGHIGGDDFFFIIPAQHIKNCCEQIIQNFSLVIPTLLNDEDRIRGYIESNDRKGNPQRFPLPSLSIAVIDLSLTKLTHPGEASAIAGELKKKVKKLDGSNYLVNRREGSYGDFFPK